MENLLRSIVDGLPCALVLHQDGEILMANNECAKLLGYTQSRELMGVRNFNTVFCRDYKRSETNYFRRDGTKINLSQHHNKIKIADKEVTCTTLIPSMVEIARENADRAVALNSANVARSRFLAAMSHEMRTPLNSVLNGSILLEGTGLDARQKELVEMVSGSANELLHRIEDVLTYSQLEEREMPDELVGFNVKEIITPLLRDIEGKAKDKGLSFKAYIDDRYDIVFMGYPERWIRIIEHICDNAVKYTYSGDVSIKLDFGEDGHGIFVQINDTGVGIAPERLRNIFDPFNFDTDPALRNEGGLSLGLALSKRIVKSMGGELKIESNIGLGSVAHVYVPFELAAIGDDEDEIDYHIALNILVAEDNRTNQKVIKLILDQLGHHTTTADDGLLCVEALKNQNFDVVLMDLHMPNMDGYEAAIAIREMGNDVPIFALTADNRPEAHDKAIQSGMDGFLTKPLMIGRLNETLSEVALKTQLKAMQASNEAPNKKIARAG